MQPLLCLGNLEDARERTGTLLAQHPAWGRTRAKPGSPL
ncbi:LMNA isoform 15 [Pongo abelii]|uniref:Lamin A/C n=3 Tax=Hominidae TaxID=9604 RepID=D6RB20_HUMAN|nr:LMNA isoform 15 [Pongo abelii]